MRKKRIMLCLVMAWLIPGPLLFGFEAQGKISLAQAIQEGLRQNAAYLDASLDLQEADLRLRLSEEDRKFRLGFDASYLYRSETMHILFPSATLPGGITIPGREIEAGLHHAYDFKLGLTQPLFTGGILSQSIKREELNQSLAAAGLTLKKNAFAGKVKSSYFRFQLLDLGRRSLLTFEETLLLHLRKIENLLAERLVPRTDLLETLSEIEKVRLSVNDFDQAIAAERIRFHRLCGFFPEQIDGSYAEESVTREEALSYFLEHHPGLAALSRREEMVAIQEKIVSGKYLPQVRAFAELHYGKPGVDFFKKEWSLYFQGGIVFSVPVFNWNRLRSDKGLLEVQARRIRNQREDLLREVTSSLDRLYASLKMLEEKGEHLSRLLELAEEEVELKDALYAERQIPNVDYLTALLARQKNALALQEVRIQTEAVRADINTLIGKNVEVADE